METTITIELIKPRLDPADYSLVALLKQGLYYARGEQKGDASVLFAQVLQHFTLTHPGLALILDALLASYENYRQAEKMLLEASKRLAEAQASQQTHLNTLEKWLGCLESNPPQPAVPVLTYPAKAEPAAILPTLRVSCFGNFQVRRQNQLLELCSNRNGQAVLRYLAVKAGHRETADVLATLLWPETAPEIARHRLVVAVSALRRSLNEGLVCPPGGGYILYKNAIYQLNPAVKFQTDLEDFLVYYQAGRQAGPLEKVREYEAACQLYQGPLLLEDLYADWAIAPREQLCQNYQVMCSYLGEHYLKIKDYDEAINWANATLAENRCDETAHQQLIRIYSATNHRSEAFQQYQRCEYLLAEELGLKPLPETRQLYERLVRGEDLAKIEPK
jgi:DNA-binding SARP family transcriptional activator